MFILDKNNYLANLKKIAEMKRLNKIDYSTMGDLILGKDNCYSPENWRKFWYIFNKIVDNIDESVEFTDEDLKKELDEKKREIQKERYKLQATKLEETRKDKHEARIELFYENIKNCIESLPIPKFREIPYEYYNEKEYILGMGDFHFGAKFNSQNNFYSKEECKRRLEKLAYSLKVEIFNNDIYKLKIINVADTIQRNSKNY